MNGVLPGIFVLQVTEDKNGSGHEVLDLAAAMGWMGCLSCCGRRDVLVMRKGFGSDFDSESDSESGRGPGGDVDEKEATRVWTVEGWESTRERWT